MYETFIPNTRAAHRMMERKNRRQARVAADSALPRPVHGLELEEIDELRHWHFELVERCLRLARLLERELGGGLGEWRMLRAVALGRAQSDAIGDIGEQLGFHKQYARELVASLAQKKKVQVRIDPIRPAAKIVLLTATGAESLRAVVEEFAETFEAIFEGMVDHHFESFDYAVRSIESTLRKRRSRRR